MGAIGASAFVFRDLLRFILPALIGGCLFVPLARFWGAAISTNAVVFGAFLGGYIIYSPVAEMASRLHDLIPLTGLSLHPLETRREWWGKNWDYDKMWTHLDKDEREYIYLTNAYFEFYQTTGFYFFSYALANISIAIWATINGHGAPEFAKFFSTPLLGHHTAPWWMTSVGALFCSYFLFRNAFLEYAALFGDEGQYVGFSEKYHSKFGGIAKSIWGRLNSAVDQKIGSATIELSWDGSPVARTDVDSDGWYQFTEKFRPSIGRIVHAAIQSTGLQGGRTVWLTPQTVPRVDIDALDVAHASSPHPSSDTDPRLEKLRPLQADFTPLRSSVDKIQTDDEVLGRDLKWRRFPGNHPKVGCIYREALDGPVRRPLTGV